MKSLILVFLGGGLGSILRFALGKVLNPLLHERFPFGTLTANVIACFIVGVVVGIIDQRQLNSSSLKAFWIIGICGGFSTFSALSHETLHLLREELSVSAILYVGISLSLGITAIIVGLFAGKMI